MVLSSEPISNPVDFRAWEEVQKGTVWGIAAFTEA
jgi:hypothetical protein